MLYEHFPYTVREYHWQPMLASCSNTWDAKSFLLNVLSKSCAGALNSDCNYRARGGVDLTFPLLFS